MTYLLCLLRVYYAKFHNWMDKKLFNTTKPYYTIVPPFDPENPETKRIIKMNERINRYIERHKLNRKQKKEE